MNDHQRPASPEVISSDDAERLLAGVALDRDDSPILATLQGLFSATRRPGERDELADAATVVAAFAAARPPIRKTAPRRAAPLSSITRRTIAILGIATGASLGTAFATGAIDNPFVPAPPIEHGPATTAHPVESTVSPSTTAGEAVSLEPVSSVPSTTVDTSIVADPSPTETATTPPPEPAPTSSESAVVPAATAPKLNPSVTAPGQTGLSPPATAPGQIKPDPSATAPGQTADIPSATAPGQTGDNPSATAPGQTDKDPKGP